MKRLHFYGRTSFVDLARFKRNTAIIGCMTTCDVCGRRLLAKSGRGSDLRYCSSACRQKAYRLRKALPVELTGADRWLNWKPVRRGERWTKMPVRLDGRSASSMDPGSWTSFEKAKGFGDRLGFALGGGFGCIDFDHVIADGVLDPVVAGWLRECPPTFIEVSPSGDGLHVWGLLPEERGRVRVVDGVQVEAYSYGRFMTVTRRPFRGSVPRLADLTDFRKMLIR